MSRVDELPADQRAALSLLLRQHKSYAEVAGMLGIAERAVHDRAHSALAILAPGQARDIDGDTRREIGDYLLGQHSAVGDRLRVRTLLGNSRAANAWATAVAAELGTLADGALPEIPPTPAVPAAQESSSSRTDTAPREPYPLAQAASAPSTLDPMSAAPSSRRGGAVLLAALAAAAIVAVVLIVSGGGGSSGKGHTKSSTTASTAKSGSTPKEEGKIALHAPAGSGSKGTVEILSEGGKRAFYIQAERIPETKHFFYAIWLYNSPSSALPLSKSPPVGKNHRLAGAALLPSNASSYKEILLTRETSTRPRHPGHVVLRGKLTLAG